MRTFFFSYRLGLRNKIPSILTIIVSPAMHFGYFTFPVTMSGTNRRSPLQCIGAPRVQRSYSSAFIHRIDIVKHKHQLHSKYQNGNYSDHCIKTMKLVEAHPTAFIEVSSWHTGKALVVHWPENQVSAY